MKGLTNLESKLAEVIGLAMAAQAVGDKASQLAKKEKRASLARTVEQMKREAIEEVLQRGGKPTLREVLRCRVSYLTRGGALGTKTFVESLFQAQRWRFGAKREEGAKMPRGGDRIWQGLRILRGCRLA